jgi:hypothetical protein
LDVSELLGNPLRGRASGGWARGAQLPAARSCPRPGGSMELLAGAETMSLDGRSGAAPLPGLSSPHASAGPLAPGEDAVHSFVKMVARMYLGERVGEWPLPVAAGPQSRNAGA